ncbi:sensor domain-containing protein [Rhodococcus sp. T7]|uniref:sensor domain-containing protein n=1 Tax=Rhodococcus sp. T7 TaxID=627444 RepID=UPI001F1A9F61|nr:sensor domain-containing protein [Rhodococcus sp. T7]
MRPRSRSIPSSHVCRPDLLDHGESVHHRLRSPCPVRTEGAPLRVVAHSVLSLPVGTVAWFVVALSVIAAFRGLFYGLITDDSYEYSWGGPTLAGAWLVHLVLGLLLVPVAVWILRGIAVLQTGTRRLLGDGGPVWVVPVALILAVAGALLFRSWLHQI